jgi:hypothetical protein
MTKRLRSSRARDRALEKLNSDGQPLKGRLISKDWRYR